MSDKPKLCNPLELEIRVLKSEISELIGMRVKEKIKARDLVQSLQAKLSERRKEINELICENEKIKEKLQDKEEEVECLEKRICRVEQALKKYVNDNDDSKSSSSTDRKPNLQG